MRKDPSRPVMISFTLLILLLLIKIMVAQNTAVSVNVGVVVDLKTEKKGLSSINMALSEFYATRGRDYKTRLVLNTRDSMEDVVGAAAAGLYLSLALSGFYIYNLHAMYQNI